MKKRWIALILIALACFAFAACDPNPSTDATFEVGRVMEKSVTDNSVTLTTAEWGELSASDDVLAHCEYTLAKKATLSVTLDGTTLTFTAVAEDGVTTQTQTVAVNVLSNATTLTLATIAGVEVEGDTVTLTTAQWTAFSGATDLKAQCEYTLADGATLAVTLEEKTLTFAVTAADGTTASKTVTVTVLSDNTTLTVTKVLGVAVEQNAITLTTAQWEELSSEADVKARCEYTLADGASLAVSLMEKTLTFEITAQDGTTDSKTLTITVLSNDTTLHITKVAGVAVEQNAITLTTAQWTAFSAETDLKAQCEYTLADGATLAVTLAHKTLTFAVTAADGTTASKTVTVNVLSNDTTITVTKVAGVAVAGNAVSLTTAQWTAFSAETDLKAQCEYTLADGATLAVTRNEKTLTFAVTAEDGTTASKTVTVTVLSNDTTLNITKVAGVDVVGESVTLTTAQWNALSGATDLKAQCEYTLADGATLAVTLDEKTLTFAITAQDGTTASKTVTVTVLSNDTTLNITKVAGVDVVGESVTFTTAQWTAFSAETDLKAQCEYTLADGATLAVTLEEKTLTFAVTAQDGTTASTTVTVTVLSNDASFAVTKLQGVEIVDGDATITQQQHMALADNRDKMTLCEYTLAEKASVVARLDDKVLTFTVTSEDGTEVVDYDVTLTVIDRIIYEGESMLGVMKITGTNAKPFEDKGTPALWSNGLEATLIPAVADAVNKPAMETEFNVDRPGTYELAVATLMNFDFGIVQYYLDGVAVGEPFDAYAKPVTAGEANLGTHYFSAGKHTLKIEVVGKNEASTGYLIGLDYISLTAGTKIIELEHDCYDAESVNVGYLGQRHAHFASIPGSNTLQLFIPVQDPTEAHTTFSLFIDKAGTYRMKTGTIMAVDFGIWQLYVNGTAVSTPKDYYNAGHKHGEHFYGNVELKQGENEFKFVCVGKNETSTNYHMGLDNVMLVPVTVDKRVEVEHQRDSFVLTDTEFEITQGMGAFTNSDNGWSNNTAILWRPKAVGATFTFDVSVSEAGEFDLTLGVTKAGDFGIFECYVNGVKVGEAFDLYETTVVHSDVAIGKAAMNQGVNKIMIKCIGQNEKAIGPLAGLDYIDLSKVTA